MIIYHWPLCTEVFNRHWWMAFWEFGMLKHPFVLRVTRNVFRYQSLQFWQIVQPLRFFQAHICSVISFNQSSSCEQVHVGLRNIREIFFILKLAKCLLSLHWWIIIIQLSRWKFAISYSNNTCPGGWHPDEMKDNACRKFWIKTLKETNLGVAGGLFHP